MVWSLKESRLAAALSPGSSGRSSAPSPTSATPSPNGSFVSIGSPGSGLSLGIGMRRTDSPGTLLPAEQRGFIMHRSYGTFH